MDSKRVSQKYFSAGFVFIGGRKQTVFHLSDVVVSFAFFWRLRSDRHIAQSLFATIYVT